MRHLRISEASLTALVDLDVYLREQFSDLQAESALVDIDQKFLKLARNPLLGRQEFQLRKNLYSYSTHPNTRIYYRFNDHELRVLLVWGTRQSNARLRRALREASSKS